MKSRNIVLKSRPTRRRNKTGIVERNIGLIKTIIGKLTEGITSASAEQILSLSCLLSNLFPGSRIISSLELVREYQPSILGLPSSVINKEILHAHKRQVATSALQKLLKSRIGNPVNPDLLSKRRPIWIWVKTTNRIVRDG